ncbi:MAG: hypothetical protein WCN85_11045, partial [Burkholderiales bacterium]
MNTPAQASSSPAAVSAAADFPGAPDAEAIYAVLTAAVAAWLAGITGRRRCECRPVPDGGRCGW